MKKTEKIVVKDPDTVLKRPKNQPNVTKTEAQRIIIRTDFPNDPFPRFIKNSERRLLVQGFPECREQDVEKLRNLAAVQIQRAFRGYFVRLRIVTYLADISLRSLGGKTRFAGSELGVRDVTTPPEQSAIDKRYQAYIDNALANSPETKASDLITYEEFSAKIICSFFRGLKPRAAFQKYFMQRKIAATKIQNAFHFWKASKGHTASSAINCIVRAWRGYANKIIYRHYVSIIKMCEGLDPVLLLKSISPREAAICDKASGSFIRFRLGGYFFPPSIYYKIYTRKPICDLGSLAPRDYTKNYSKRELPVIRHLKGTPKYEYTEGGWYERQENNGWRVISLRNLLPESADPVTTATNKKTILYHHNKLANTARKKQEKKKAKFRWLRTMYKEGMLKSKGAYRTDTREDDSSLKDSIDEEMNRMLEWTKSLNFDEYSEQWTSLAVSGCYEEENRDNEDLTDGEPNGKHMLTSQTPFSEGPPETPMSGRLSQMFLSQPEASSGHS
eukprot:Nk52_evm12s352 gene=Nk52_evmTU12s352